jgi:hypothetical protein
VLSSEEVERKLRVFSVSRGWELVEVKLEKERAAISAAL